MARLETTLRGKLNHPSMIATRRDCITPFSQRVSLEAQQILYGYPSHVWRGADAIERHLTYATGSDGNSLYSLQEQHMAFAASDLFAYAHGSNARLKSRVRRDGQPYIAHPMGVEADLAGITREIEVPIVSGSDPSRKLKLQVKQHPYATEVIIAGNGHDVDEDVILPIDSVKDGGTGIVVGRKKNDIKWSQMIGEHLRLASGATKEQVIDITTMIRGVTGYRYHQIPPEVRQDIIQHDLFRGFVREAMERDRSLTEKSARRHVLNMLADRHKTMATCFPIGRDKKPIRSSKGIKRYLGIQAILGSDNVRNLEDGDVRPHKLVRDLMTAEIARFFGLPVASLIGVLLIANNKYDFTTLQGVVGPDQLEMVEHYCNIESSVTPRPVLRVGDYSKPILTKAVQIPIVTHAEQRVHGDRNHRPVLQYQCVVSDKFFNYLKRFDGPIPLRIGNKGGFKLERLNAPVHDLIRSFGRKCEYYSVEDAEGKLVRIIRFEDNQPSAHTVLAQGSTRDALEVPEHKILMTFDGSAKSTMDILAKLCPFKLS